MRKVRKNMCENVEKQTLSCRLPVPTTLILFTPGYIPKILHVSGFRNIYFLPLGQIFLELFSFTHGAFFLGHPVFLDRLFFSNTSQ